jgi:hypothetical protein
MAVDGVERSLECPRLHKTDRPLVAGSEISSPRRLAVIRVSASEGIGSFQPLEPTDTAGQKRSLAVTSQFLLSGVIEWLVFGEQVDPENFRIRPIADHPALHIAAICTTGLLRDPP